MVVAGVLGGLGAGAIDAAINAHAAVAFSPRVVTWLHACYGVGATVGPLLMTVAVTGPLGWRGGYGAIALILAAMTACFAATVHLWSRPALPAAPAVASAAEIGAVEPGAGEPGGGSSGLVGTLRRPATWAGIALFFLYTGLEVSAGQWAYSLLTESRGTTEAMAGAWVSAYWGSLTVGRIAVGGLATRLPAVALLRLGMLAAPVAGTLLWLAHGPLGSLLALVLLGLSFAGVFPLLIAETPARLGIAATRHAVGFQVAGACLGVAVLPGAVGVLAAHAGLEVTGPAIAVGALALLGLHEAVLRTTPHADSSPGAAPRKI
jgi:fucose permease